jgi:quinol-cytochrome oxidoreductase complex cytochrome b subunit
MKRCLLYSLALMLGVGGFLVILCGILFVPSAHGPARSNWWRLVSAGMVMVGFSFLLNLRKIPDYVPEWVKRYFAPIYTLLWFVAGGIIFILSWF